MDPRSFPGCTIGELASVLLKEATENRSMVMGDFNGTPMIAYPGGSTVEMILNWQIVREEQQSQH